MTASDEEREKLAEWFRDSIKDARADDRDMADGLLRDFAHLAENPSAYDAVGGVPIELIRYIATCISDWQRRDYRDAETWFNVERPDHRPPVVDGRHVSAMRAYMVLRARGHGVEGSRRGAAAYSGLTEDQVRYVTESHPGRETLNGAVMFSVTPRLRVLLVRPPPRKKYQRRV